mmetsp:Transcript_4154/g.6270  ORF Transcript_4154/g.6270 Transcript_4154/m.6270 type:complete len:133 (+) Transcript_4154:281-679(+)
MPKWKNTTNRDNSPKKKYKTLLLLLPCVLILVDWFFFFRSLLVVYENSGDDSPHGYNQYAASLQATVCSSYKKDEKMGNKMGSCKQLTHTRTCALDTIAMQLLSALLFPLKTQNVAKEAVPMPIREDKNAMQ